MFLLSFQLTYFSIAVHGFKPELTLGPVHFPVHEDVATVHHHLSRSVCQLYVILILITVILIIFLVLILIVVMLILIVITPMAGGSGEPDAKHPPKQEQQRLSC